MKNKNSNLSGIQIDILNNIREENHFHPEIEIIFIISGTLSVATRDKDYQLLKNDIILFNSNIGHKIESIGQTTICRVHISYKMLAQVVNNGDYIFYCNSVADKRSSYDDLQEIMKRIIFAYIENERKTECLKYALIYELLDKLIENFQENKDYYKYKKKNKENEQIEYIINYVNLNFQNSVNLNEIAKKMFTSPSTLSRFFKKQLGIYFGDFVNQVRLNYAVKELLDTDKAITKIAIDCGFNSAAIFSKNFQNKYHMSPTAYRKQEFFKKEYSEDLVNSDMKKLKQELLLFKKEETNKKQSSELKVQVSVANVRDYKKFWNSVLNVGSAHNIILANVQSHITYLIEELKFEYIRIWNIFSKKLMIQKSNRDLNYNFNMVDTILDFLVANDVKPFIDFGKRPDCAVKGEGETVYYEEDYIDFNSIKEWNNMFERFIFHIIKRYGKEAVELWKFEFSVDIRPGRFYTKDYNMSFEEIFEYNFKFLKKYLPNVEVGGFGAVIDINSNELISWLNYCKENNCIPDFVSIICFPYIQVKDDNQIFAKRITDETAIADKILMARNDLDRNGFSNCKLYVTEWNNSLSSRNYLNDSCFRAAYVAKIINELWNIPDVMSLWMGSDLVSSHYDTARIANGSSGIITKDKIRKPVYYAIAFLNRLGVKFIQKGENYIVTSDGTQSYYIFCFNYKEFSCNYYLKDENNLEIDKLSELFENDDDLKLHIDLTEMPENQKFTIKKYIINDENGSVLSEWSKFQYEKDIESNDLKYLSERCIPELTIEKRVVDNGILTIHTVLKSHEISLIHVYEAL